MREIATPEKQRRGGREGEETDELRAGLQTRITMRAIERCGGRRQTEGVSRAAFGSIVLDRCRRAGSQTASGTVPPPAGLIWNPLAKSVGAQPASPARMQIRQHGRRQQ
ncbi:hypothetical protein Dda_7760 [Drechslerella dactyloides]|uniref:Uncharacterized protein n=1 Tax=Drechslerella dactyloides TaxID=74499 RepID=A0AAD6IUP2_DREDA|nr:hypothetical protein Dda_7760 [Drechslerella dactyloides]